MFSTPWYFHDSPCTRWEAGSTVRGGVRWEADYEVGGGLQQEAGPTAEGAFHGGRRGL